MTTASATTAVNTRRPGRCVAAKIAGLVMSNLVAAFAALLIILGRNQDELLPQDVWGPFVVALGAQAVLNGACLLAFERTRKVGAGVLAGTALAVLLFFAWLWFVVFPNFY